MARTRLQTVAKIGPLEIKRRVQAAEPAKKPSKHILKGGQGVTVGVAGNTGYWGSPDSGEHVRKLQGAAGRVIWDKMRRSDPQVQATLAAITLPIRQARYYVEPASEDIEDVEIAAVIEERLMSGMSMTWDDVMRHILLMLPFGFSILEKVWEATAEGLILPRKLDPRLPQSIVRWDYDKAKKRLIGPVQMDEDGREIVLPIEKLLVFTNSREGDNWEGVSVLRGAYKPWVLKDDLEKINGMQHDRHGVGVPVGKVPKGVTKDSPEWQDMEDALAAIQANEQGYIVAPEGWEIDLLGGQGKTGTNVLPSIKYYDEKISIALLAMFMILGTSQTGSRALGQSFTETFMIALQAYADYIAEVVDRFLVKEMVDYNWAVERYPTFRAGRIKQIDLGIVADLAKWGVLSKTPELEDAVREELHLPEKPEDQEQTSQPEQAPEEDAGQVTASAPHVHVTYAKREFSAEEMLADIPAIEMRLDTETQDLEASVLRIRDEQLRDLIIQLAGGRKVHQLRIIGKKDMHDLLLREYKRQFKQGRQEVRQEVENQIGDAVKKYSDTPSSFDEFLALMLEELAIKVEGAADKLKSMLAAWAVDLKKQGLSGEALRQGLEERAQQQISDRTWSDLARTAVNRGWGDGRQVELQVYEGGVDYYYRSGILDSNICEVCRPKDGRTVTPGDPDFQTPDPNCLGGPACRCMTIAVMRAESAAEEAARA